MTAYAPEIANFPPIDKTMMKVCQALPSANCNPATIRFKMPQKKYELAKIFFRPISQYAMRATINEIAGSSTRPEIKTLKIKSPPRFFVFNVNP